MKKTLLFLCLALLVACSLWGPTFEQVSQPYLDAYGQPEDVYRYSAPGWQSVDWWWWSYGFEVTFVNDGSGWEVYSTYSFSPIY